MEFVSIVGSRIGADYEHVERFVRALHARQPDTVLVSGGANGVDKLAESLWLELGGEVWSFRVRQLGLNRFGIEKWELGGEQPRVFVLNEEPTFANWMSAAIYRNALIAEHGQRVVAFYKRGLSRGTQVTVDFAVGAGRKVYEYEVGRIAA